MRESLEKIDDILDQARQKEAQGSKLERALFNTLFSRYPKEGREKKDFPSWNMAYSNAVEKIYDDFGDDLDVAVLYAESLMIIKPWKLWDADTGKPTEGAKTLEAKQVLEKALAKDEAWENAGLLHLYVHLMEMSSVPEQAMPAADRLRNLVPDAGHLLHMSSHLDVLVGDYRAAVRANELGVNADERYLARNGSLGFYAMYKMHNYHSLFYAAMYAGQSKVALKWVDKFGTTIPEQFLHGPMLDFFEWTFGLRYHVLLRFGMFDEVIDAPLPKDQELYAMTTATQIYARGVAYSATGRIKEAESTRTEFLAAVKRVPESRKCFPDQALVILKVAEAMLDGELEYRKGNYDVAFEHLRKAIKLDDALSYAEPWQWMQPARHAYAALQLEQGNVEIAAKTYAEDLGLDSSMSRRRHHPNNVWSLHGYHECLLKLGRKAEASVIQQQLTLAMAVADVPIKSSCYCRTDAGDTVTVDAVERAEKDACCH